MIAISGLDTNLRIITIHYNQDNTSSLKVSGKGLIIGDMGNNDEDFGTLFGSLAGGNPHFANICEDIRLPYDATVVQDTLVENYLLRWNPSV